MQSFLICLSSTYLRLILYSLSLTNFTSKVDFDFDNDIKNIDVIKTMVIFLVTAILWMNKQQLGLVVSMYYGLGMKKCGMVKAQTVIS